MKRSIIFFIGIIILAGLVHAAEIKDIAFIVNSQDNLDSDELAIISKLESENYSFDYFGDNTNFDADNYKLIIVGDGTNNFNLIFNSTQKKTLFISNSAARKVGLGFNEGLSTGTRTTEIINNSHEITSDLILGDINVYQNPQEILYLKSCFALGSNTLARHNLNSNAVIVSAEKGSKLIRDSSCTKRDIELTERNLFFGINKASAWTENSSNLFAKSVDWVISDINKAPIFEGNISDASLLRGESYEIDLSDYFSDPNGDELTYEIVNISDDLQVEMDGSVIGITSNFGWIGNTNIAFSASDEEFTAFSNEFNLEFTSNIISVDLISPDENEILNSNHSNSTSLLFSFTLAEDANIFCSANFDGDLRSYASSFDGVEGENIYAFFIENPGSGNHTWSITCSEGFSSKTTETRSFKINEPNYAPQLKNQIGDINWSNGTYYEIDLSDYFSDPNGDELTYGIIEVTSLENITYTIRNSIVRFESDPLWIGEEKIFFLALDEEFSVTSNPVVLTVFEKEVNRAPVFNGPIPNVTLMRGESYEIDLSDYFSDSNGDELTYEIVNISDDLQVEMDGSVAKITTRVNWVGNGDLSFSASDEEFTAFSNKFNLEFTSNIISVDLISPDEGMIFEANETEPLDFHFSFDTIEEGFFVCSINIDGNTIESKNIYSLSGTTIEFFFLENLSYGEHSWSITCSENVETKTSEAKTFTIREPIEPSAPFIFDISNKEIKVGENLFFEIIATDDNLNSLEILAEGIPNGALFNDKGQGVANFNWTPQLNQSGIYSLKFIARDSEGLESSEEMSITVNSIPSQISFGDIDTCEVISDKVIVDIRDPRNGEDFELGDEIDVEVEITNLLDDDYDFDVEVYLYDIDEDEVVKDLDDSIEIDENDEEKIEFNLEIPNDVDTDNRFAVFVKAESEDDDCNQNYVEIEIEKPDSKVVIENIYLNPAFAAPGDIVDLELRAENIGEDDEDVYVEVVSNELKISEKSEEIEIEEDEKETFVLSFEIPEDAEEGYYNLDVTLVYGGDRDRSQYQIEIISRASNSGGSGGSGSTVYSPGIITLGTGNGNQASNTQNKEITLSKKNSLINWSLKDVEIRDILWLIILGILILILAIIIVQVQKKKRMPRKKRVEFLRLKE